MKPQEKLASIKNMSFLEHVIFIIKIKVNYFKKK